MIGHVYSDATITNCSIDADSSVSCAEDRSGSDAKAGALIGTVNKRTTRINNCSSAATVNNVNAQQPVADGLVGRVCALGQVIIGEENWTTHTVFANLLNSGSDIELNYNYHLGEVGTTIAQAEALIDSMTGTKTIDGKKHTIYGLVRPLITSRGESDITIKDLTISNANIKSTRSQANGMGTAAFVGYIDFESNSLVMDNCKLVYSHVEGLEEDVRTAGLVGHVSQGTVSITNCVVENCTIKSADGAAAIINITMATTTISNCKVLGNTSITSTEVRNSNSNTAFIVGSVQPSSTTTISDIEVSTTVTISRAGTATPVHAWVGRIISGGSATVDGTAL